ncbi:phosphate propanoyltransferase [uncultured Enterococcus sp.]|uniref:phosphate propanoyltransferase n=1 Tax=uncultured Enterococcus sp. TaxID=167972 RepID=UPI002AA82B22|nr:phosphate propanoyltransferase [uncultured Enterococcus sp.]
MKNQKELLQLFINILQTEKTSEDIGVPLGISNRHIHLAQNEIDQLFGTGYQLTKLKELSQPGQYACKETVMICGPKGVIEKVRVLGPARSASQVEVMTGDCFKLGLTVPVRQSGEISDTPGITIVGSAGSATLKEGVIVAQRHIHMSPEDAHFYQVTDGERVMIKLTGERGGVFDNVVIRVSKDFRLECHLDVEEANAMGLNSKSKVYIIKNNQEEM